MLKTEKYFNTFLKDSNNNIEIIGDYTYEKEDFKFKNILSSDLIINKVTIISETKVGFTCEYYGNSIVLKNGITFKYTSNGDETNIITKSYPIKANKDWFFYGCDIKEAPFITRGKKIQSVVFDFTNNKLKLNLYDSITFTFNDDFTKMEGHKILIEGSYTKTIK